MSADNNRQTRSSGNAAGQPGASRPRPALDPAAPALTQPYKDLVGRGIISSVSVTFTPMGVQVYGTASAKLVAVNDSGLNTTDHFPLAKLVEVAEAGGLTTAPKTKKKKGAAGPSQVKPAKSLVAEDLDGSLSAEALQQRINSIAKACGGGPLVGRVRSEGAFTGDSTVSFRQWWDEASVDLRALCLTEGKRRKTLTPDHIGRLSDLQCPFRGTLEFQVAASGQDDE